MMTTNNPVVTCAPLAPTFTDEDEQRELATLSPTEIASAEADLRGISSGLAMVSITAKEKERAFVAAEMFRLNSELFKIPIDQKSVYLHAIVRCPELVNDERRMAFLEGDEFDAKLAAQRLVKYWETKLAVFGPDKCFLPMTLGGAMKGEVAGLLKYCPIQVLPVKDTAGRAIILADPSRRDLSKYSSKSAMRAIWYMLETLAEDPEVRRRGVVNLADGRNLGREHYDAVTVQFINLGVWDILPLKCRSIHMCHISFAGYYMLYPMVKYLIGRDLRLRLKMHYGSTDEVLQHLADYCLPRDCVPAELGGDLSLDLEKWVNDRSVVECQQQLRQGQDPDRPAADTDLSTRAAKRMRSESKQSAGYASSRPINVSSLLSIDSTFTCKLGDSNDKKRGRKSDSRMDRAVMEKLANPDLTSEEALIAGGFEFPRWRNAAEDALYDENNVSLRQRKNQLNRRLRKEKNKQPAENGGALSRSNGNELGSDDKESESQIPHANPTVRNERPNIDGAKFQELSPCDGEKEGSTGDVSRRDSIDSFYDSIMELPGIEDLDAGAWR